MIELFIVKKDHMIDVPVESVGWGGARYKAPRTLTATFLSTNRGFHRIIQANEGDTVIFRWKGQELFQGTLFRIGKDKSGIMMITAYDLLKYMLENRDRYVFVNRRADQILQRICSDFSIPTESIVNTGFTIPSLVFENETTLYDMVMKALSITYKQTGVRYTLQSNKGKVKLIKVKDNLKKWVIEEGVNLIDYNFETSIEDTITRVKLESGDENNTIIATANNNELQRKFGVMQHYERVSEDINKAQLTERANKILSENSKPSREFDIDAVGLPDVISGTGIHVIEQELSIKKGFYVMEDDHSFNGNEHLMSLKLSETDELPEVE